jgi:amino acid transporter
LQTKRLNQPLGTRDAVSLTVGTMVGAGIFSVFSLTVKTTGWSAGFSWILIVVLSLPMAYSFSDLTGATAVSGGPYVYLRQKHKSLGLWVALLFLLSAVGAAEGLYTSLIGMMAQIGLSHNQAWLCATLLLAFLTGVVVRGLHLSARVARGFTWITLAILCTAIGIGFSHAHLFLLTTHTHTTLSVASTSAFPHGWRSLLVATFYAFWTYSGWEAVSVPSGAYQSSRQLARGMMIGSAIVGLLYILVAWSALVSVPVHQLASVMNPLALVGSLLGEPFRVLIEWGTLVIVAGSILSWLIAASGLFQAAAREQLFPAPQAVRSHLGEYHWSVPLLCFALIVGLGRAPIFTAAISASSLTALFAYAMVFGTLLLDRHGSWRGVIQSVRLRQFTAGLSLCVSLFLIIVSGWTQLWPSLLLAALGLGCVGWRRRSMGNT